MRAIKKTKVITNRTSDQVQRYFTEVSRYPMVTVEEEVELARLIRRGGEEGECAKRRLVEANLRFVINVANQYSGRDTDLLDLISEGNIGLIKAAEKFDETRGFKFISYAVWWIRQQITQSLIEKGRVIRIPCNMHAILNKYRKENELSLHRDGIPLQVDEFCDMYGYDDKVAGYLVDFLMPALSTNATIGQDDTTIEDYLVSEEGVDEMDNQSLCIDLHRALDKLSKKEREVITQTFGLGCTEKSLEETANMMGLTRERVRQIRIKAIKRLQGLSSTNTLRSYL